jgi:hypothetical protein
VTGQGPTLTRDWAGPVAAGLVAVVVVCVVGRAWLAGTNDPDSMNSVLYFQRILAGERLEVTVLTTPKPLLTVLYGASWDLLHDWRMLVWLTIAAHGVGVAAAVRLATRLAGVAAGAFIAVALIASPMELTEVTHANALPWALAGWAVAGLAVTATPRRFGLAGAALLLAGLARTETWLIDAAITLTIAVMAIPAVRARLPGSAPSVRSTLPLLLVAWLALPIQWTHDLLLTGDPLYTLGVPAAYTTVVTPGLRSIDPVTFAHAVLLRYAAAPVVVALAMLGFGYLIGRRQWEIVVPLATLTLGVLVFLAYLALRAVYVSNRYYEEPALGLLFAASVGAGALVRGVLRTAAPSRGQPLGDPARAAALVAVVLLALLVVVPGSGAGQLIRRTSELQDASQNLERVLPALGRAVRQTAGPSPGALRTHGGLVTFYPSRVPLFVPGPFLGRIAVELDVPLTQLGDNAVAFLSAAPSRVLRPGQEIYHDAVLDAPPATFRALEVIEPTSIGSLRVVPLDVRPGAYWLLRVER